MDFFDNVANDVGNFVSDVSWGVDSLTTEIGGAVDSALGLNQPVYTQQPTPNLDLSSLVLAGSSVPSLDRDWSTVGSTNVLGGSDAWGGAQFNEVPSVYGGGAVGDLAKKGLKFAGQYGDDALRLARLGLNASPQWLAGNVAWEAATYVAPKVWDHVTERPDPPQHPAPPIPPPQGWPDRQ